MQKVRIRMGYGKVPRYRVNRRRLSTLLALVSIFIVLLILVWIQGGSYSYYEIGEFDPQHLEMYFQVEQDQGVPWYYMAAADKAELIPPHEISPGRSGQIALHLRGITSPNQVGGLLKDYRNDAKFIRKLKTEIKKFNYMIGVYEEKIFPIASGYNYNYSNDYGAGRSFGGARSHEGIDLMCGEGVPLVSVCDGVVEKKGWLELGGWRIGIRGKDGVYYYYAHLSRYEEGLEEKSKVKKGQIIGYAGDTGYGTEGTTGKFDPHLHFGMYEKDGWIGSGLRAVNPYPFLKAWEK